MIPESLLDHIDNPKGKIVKDPENYQWSGKLSNSCGDVIRTFLDSDESKIKIYWDGKGCVLSMASASILFQYLDSKNVDYVNQQLELISGYFIIPDSKLQMPEDIILLKTQFTRVGCLLLPWTNLKIGIANLKLNQNIN